MPGTPATSARFGAPRYANGDASDFAGQVNGVTDVFDALAARFESGLLSARPSTGLGIANRYYFATDNGRLYRDAGGATPTWSEVTPQAHAASHAAGGADALTVTEAMMATGANGLGKGKFSAYRNAASSLASGAVIPFDTEERDVSSWFDVTTNVGRYTPQVAGYYRLNAGVTGTPGTGSYVQAIIRKNGANYKLGNTSYQNGGVGVTSVAVAEVEANGTTDFFDVTIVYAGAGPLGLSVGAAACFFQGSLVGRS